MDKVQKKFSSFSWCLGIPQKMSAAVCSLLWWESFQGLTTWKSLSCLRSCQSFPICSAAALVVRLSPPMARASLQRPSWGTFTQWECTFSCYTQQWNGSPRCDVEPKNPDLADCTLWSSIYGKCNNGQRASTSSDARSDSGSLRLGGVTRRAGHVSWSAATIGCVFSLWIFIVLYAYTFPCVYIPHKKFVLVIKNI